MTAQRGFTGLAGAVGSSLLLGIVSVLGAAAIATATGATANTWTVAADNLQAPGYQTATVLADGRVLVVGGQGTKAELFDSATGSWGVAASMNRSRAYATATLLPKGFTLLSSARVRCATPLRNPSATR